MTIARHHAGIRHFGALPALAEVDPAATTVLVNRFEALPLSPRQVFPLDGHSAQINVGFKAVHATGNRVQFTHCQVDSAHRLVRSCQESSRFQGYGSFLRKLVGLPDSDFVDARGVEVLRALHAGQDHCNTKSSFRNVN